MKAKRTNMATLAGMLLVAAAAVSIASVASATTGPAGTDPGFEVRVVPVEEVGRMSPQLVRRPRLDGGPQVEVWTSPGTGATVYPGQEMTVRFRTDRDAYVVVYDIDTRGNLRLLYPERPGDDGFVRGGIARRLPGRHAGYRLMVTGPPGLERIVALASDRPLVHRWRVYAEADLADAGLVIEGALRTAGGAVLEAGIRVGDEDSGMTAAIHVGGSVDSSPRLAPRPVAPRLVPVPRGQAPVGRDETWFRVGRRWRW